MIVVHWMCGAMFVTGVAAWIHARLTIIQATSTLNDAWHKYEQAIQESKRITKMLTDATPSESAAKGSE